MKSSLLHLLLFPLWLLPLIVHGQVSGKIIYVTDGDTFSFVSETGEKSRIRLADVDCPETPHKTKDDILIPGQDFGYEAKAFALELILGKEVVLKVKEIGEFKRLIAFVYIDGIDLSAELLKAGYAWHYKKYSDRDDYAKLEQEARDKRLGLWSAKEPEAPGQFRWRTKKQSR